MLACILGSAGFWGCRAAPETQGAADLAARLEDALAQAGRRVPEEGLVVRLAFGAEADLDLFVSDPRSETVYFGNRRARSGGRLAADLRCDAPVPRIETVRFEHPLPGRYRIGVDYPGSCSGDAKPATFVVEWRSGGAGSTFRGRARPLTFDAIAAEFDLPPPETPR